jgi:hypothetical protein
VQGRAWGIAGKVAPAVLLLCFCWVHRADLACWGLHRLLQGWSRGPREGIQHA